MYVCNEIIYLSLKYVVCSLFTAHTCTVTAYTHKSLLLYWVFDALQLTHMRQDTPSTARRVDWVTLE